MKLSHSPSLESRLEAQLKRATDQGITTRVIVTEQGLEVIEASSPTSEQNEEEKREEELLNARQAWTEQGKTGTPGTGSTLVSTELSEGETAATSTEPDKFDRQNHDLTDRKSHLALCIEPF